ncbi:MAG: FtsX-like permease family protein [Lactobacillales bacterium]|jgi:putative ABC transport system permease protein|nr:FtsX-like permease family protein [Lactobacillales bacterium]
MKLRDIFTTASSNLMRNKGRTILTIVAIFIGAVTISLTTGLNAGINNYIDNQLNSAGGKNVLVVLNQPETKSSGPAKYEPETEVPASTPGSNGAVKIITKAQLAKISAVKNVKHAGEYAMPSITYIEGPNGTKYEGAVNATVPGVEMPLKVGVHFDGDNKTKPEIILTPEYVKPLGFKSAEASLGKTVTLAASTTPGPTGPSVVKTFEAKVVAVGEKSLLMSNTSILNSAATDKIREITQIGMPEEMKDNYLAVMAQLKPGLTDSQINDAKKAVEKLGFKATTIDDEIGMVKNIINAITGVLTFFGAIALVAAAFGIINTLFMSVQERTREIGLMKAMGLSSGKVFLSFSVEAILIGFWGSALGVLGATGFGALVNTVAQKSFLKGLDGLTLISMTPQNVVLVMAIIIFIAFLAGTLPARRAAAQDPIEALRYE